MRLYPKGFPTWEPGQAFLLYIRVTTRTLRFKKKRSVNQKNIIPSTWEAERPDIPHEEHRALVN